MNAPDHKTDHREEAQAILKAASEEPAEEVQPIAIAEAQVHSQLAVADELRLIREMFGPSTDGKPAEVTVDGHVTTGAP